PAPPPPKPRVFGIPGAVQPEAPLQHTDPPLHPRSPAIPAPEPRSPFRFHALRRRLARIGDHHPFDARCLRLDLVLRRPEPPVPRQHFRRLAELLAVLLQAGGEVW